MYEFVGQNFTSIHNHIIFIDEKTVAHDRMKCKN